MKPRLLIVPLDFAEANELVARWHRHHKPQLSHKFSIGVAEVLEDGTLRICGAAIVGRPVARMNQDGWTLEVTRCSTDGTPNACSALYAAAWRAARAMGYQRLITYTRTDESGASLRGAGWAIVGKTKARTWNMPGRPRVDKTEPHPRFRWEISA